MTQGRTNDYDNWHAHVAHLEHSQQDNLQTPWHQLLLEHLLDVDGQRLLEIACGRGSLSLELCSRGARVTAADVSGTAVEITERLLANNPNVDSVCQADAMNLPFPSSSFDGLVSCETLEHVPDPQKAVSEFMRVTKPGARLYVTVPSYLNATGLVRLYLKAVGRPYNSGVLTQPIENWTFVTALAREFRRQGGRIETIDGIGHYFPLPRRNPVDCRAVLFDTPFLRPVLKYFALHTLLIIVR